MKCDTATSSGNGIDCNIGDSVVASGISNVTRDKDFIQTMLESEFVMAGIPPIALRPYKRVYLLVRRGKLAFKERNAYSHVF